MNLITHPGFIPLANSALSNALALESLLNGFIEKHDVELLSSAESIASDQVSVINKLKDITSPGLSRTAIRLSSRTCAVYVMLIALLRKVDDDLKAAQNDELPEAVLTMMEACSILIKEIKYSDLQQNTIC